MGDFSSQQKITYCRVAKIAISLANLFRANFSMTRETKLGGPTPFNLYNKATGTSWSRDTMWPGGKYPNTDSSETASSTPDEWWRWALIFVHPSDTNMCFKSPKMIYPEEMLENLGGYQVFTHRFTKLKVLATSGSNSTFSPVASLLTQDQYFYRERGTLQGQIGQLPYTGCICTRNGTGSSASFLQDEGFSPWLPPNKVNIAANTTYNVGQTVTCEWAKENCIYSPQIYMSFATLSALGAPWSFPSNQKPIGRGSFNRHSMKGVNDPQGEKWLTLVPKKDWWITTDESVPKSGIKTVIGELYLAQGNTTYNAYKYGTYQHELEKNALICNTWAIVKIKSMWTLGNKRRPYEWDVNWWNQIGTSGV